MEVISNRWSNLKRRAQNERDPERLIQILGEIDDLLAGLEKRIAAQDKNLRVSFDGDPISEDHESGDDLLLDDSGIWSQ